MAASKRMLAAFVLLLPAVSACELVLGLGDYSKGDGGPDGIDGGLEASLDAPSDTATIPDVFSTPADWAKWRMPNPSFKLSNDASTDAKYNTGAVASVGPFSFDGGTFTLYADRYQGEDAGTGLLWIFEPSASNSVKDFAAATTYCANRGGRVPTRIELLTLVDFSQTSGTRTVSGVPQGAIGPQRYWTSSLVRPYSPDSGIQYWAVSFDTKSTDLVSTAAGNDLVVCLRAQ